MAYSQLRTPNLDPVIYVGNSVLRNWAGWCLAYVEVAFGTQRLYPSAWEAWNKAKHRHTNRDFPRNVYFPVWFSHHGSYGSPPRYDNWGHVAIARVADNGSMVIWSSPASAKASPDTYYSIEQIERIYSSKYVGWSEDIAQTQVIESQGGSMNEEEHRRRWAESVVDMVMDIIEGDPHYRNNKPEAWQGHVNRLLNAKRVHEERYFLRDILKYNKWVKNPKGAADPAVQDKADRFDQIKNALERRG